jgi:hypothetical protein
MAGRKPALLATIEALKEAGIRDQVRVIGVSRNLVFQAPVSQSSWSTIAFHRKKKLLAWKNQVYLPPTERLRDFFTGYLPNPFDVQ